MDSEDWGFCKQALQRFSRTFAVPIALLPGGLERTITCAYLLCRIADTIEDAEHWNERTRDRLFRDFLDALGGQKDPAEFVTAVTRAGAPPEEFELLLEIARVLRVFEQTPEVLRRTCEEWIAELTLGMVIYARRRPGPDKIRCLSSEPDLERYCYFVAGTIGHLLTETFVSQIDGISQKQSQCLRENAERFGAGLQLVNILRDIRSDLERGFCFVPRTLLAGQGLAPLDLVQAGKEQHAYAALLPLFERAESHLEASLTYVLSIPPSAPGVRQFCLVPLWLAVETLFLCKQDPRLLLSGQRVKLSRARVAALVQECIDLTTEDTRLRTAYGHLRR